jgi:hypothetical protein
MYLVKQGENQNFRRPVPPDYGDSSNTSPGDLRAKRHMNMRNLQVLGHCAIDNEEKKLRYRFRKKRGNEHSLPIR